ncbi:AMP-binding protein [Streptomyces anulatus]|uniref:AMP-binding protein n=1 Tax=Streptomyces anulatus TaxID=1892 RepID=UPI002E31DB0F|nr:AMP-binding protein [Streptomyces anulatus]
MNESDLRHRTERLTGAPDLSTIPSDRTRPAELSTDGARIALRLDEDLTSAVRRFARATRTTPFAVLTAAAVALLHRHGTGDDIVVGTPMSRRANAGLDPVMDCLTDLMPLAFAVGADLSFRDLVRSARSEVLDLVRHRDVPFGELVRRTATAGQLGRFPLFQTVVQLNDGPESGLNLPGATAERLYAHSGTAKFDLCIGLAAENEAFRGFLDCATDLYAPATARRIADRYRTLPTSVLADPGLPLAETPLLSSDAYEVVTLTWACAARPADPPPVQAAFEACRRRTSNAAAAVWHDRQLTYEELGAAADRLAHQLIRTSSSGRAMGILMDHCPDMTVAVLAVLKSGSPYVPLDPAYPADRLAYMIEDSGLHTLLTQPHLRDRCALPPSVRVLGPEQWNTEARPHPADPGLPESGPADLAYLMYTSGSTGKPKGVAMPHGPVSGLVQWQCRNPLRPRHRRSRFDLPADSVSCTAHSLTR